MNSLMNQPAPDFELYSSDKQLIKLSDYRGKNVVLLFFPAAFTGTCTKELCQVRDEMSLYNGLEAQVVAVSVDMLFTLAKYKTEQSYQFPLLSDFNKTVSAAYYALYDHWLYEMKGVSKRASFVIDKEGFIRFSEILENASDYPDFQGIKKALESLN